MGNAIETVVNGGYAWSEMTLLEQVTFRQQALDELEQLRARIAKLEAVAEAAKRYAGFSSPPKIHGDNCLYCEIDIPSEDHKDWCNYEISANDLEAALMALG